MATEPITDVRTHLQMLFDLGVMSSLADGQWLERLSRLGCPLRTLQSRLLRGAGTAARAANTPGHEPAGSCSPAGETREPSLWLDQRNIPGR